MSEFCRREDDLALRLRPCEPSVHRQQWAGESLSERDIEAVLHTDGVPQGKSPHEHRLVDGHHILDERCRIYERPFR